MSQKNRNRARRPRIQSGPIRYYPPTLLNHVTAPFESFPASQLLTASGRGSFSIFPDTLFTPGDLLAEQKAVRGLNLKLQASVRYVLVAN